jgi:RNA polymerase sigma factor (sigma-70 family)
MASGGYGPVIRQVERLLEGGGTAVALGEAQLLRRFAVHRDEAAFEALVSRHGPMVLGTCRRMLADPLDVEDAFQATFLVLARKAGSIQDGDRLGPWLHGVARRVATRSRALTVRRNARERPAGAELAVFDADTFEALEIRSALDEELARLPEKYRAPLVLCYLEGLTHDEAARQLSWPVGTVRSRLAGGRDRLRTRLTRRGLSPSASIPAALPVAAMPEALLSSTVRVAMLAGSAPAHLASLAKGALVAMIWHKFKAVAAVGLLAGLAAGGAVVLAIPGGGGQAIADPSDATRGGVEREQAIPASDDLMKLQGRWKQIKLQPAPGDTLARLADKEWVIEGRALIVREGGKEVWRYELTLGAENGAKTIDLVAVQGLGFKTTERGIYRLEGDTFEICSGPPDGPRPAEFKAGNPDSFQWLTTFERQGGYPRPDLAGPKAGSQPPPASKRTVKQVQDEMQRLKQDLDATTRKVEELRFQIKPLEEEWKALASRGDVDAAVTKPARPDTDPPAAPAPVPAPPDRAADPFAPPVAPEGGTRPRAADPFAPPVAPEGGTRPAPPTVMTVGGNPTVFAVISANRDRVTMIDSVTRNKATFRIPGGATELIPISGAQLVSLIMKGREIRRVGLYDRKAGRWFEHDLGEPATEVQPLMGPTGLVGFSVKAPEIRRLLVFDATDGTWAEQALREPAEDSVAPTVSDSMVQHRIGRFFYTYSQPAKKWSVLELKEDPEFDFGGKFGNLGLAAGGRMMVPDGDLIHIYDPKTGEWTHIDTKDEK